MQNDVILEKMDDCIEESCWLRKGTITIETFDYVGKLWPLITGRCYRVDLDLGQLDFEDPIIIYETIGRAEQINDTFAHYLYGYVKNNIFHVGEFAFDFEKYNDYGQYENKFLKFKADRIYAEFIEELPTQNNR